VSLLAGAVVLLSGGASLFAAEKAFQCTPIEVGTFPGKRIHVRCSPGDGDIKYFALGVSNASEANRTLSILSTAYAAKKRLQVWYDPDDVSGSAIGCKKADCRLIRGVQVYD
jgi:hypothetical protein